MKEVRQITDNLDDAIEIVNATGYGLTSGLESLDKREQDIWREKLLVKLLDS